MTNSSSSPNPPKKVDDSDRANAKTAAAQSSSTVDAGTPVTLAASATQQSVKIPKINEKGTANAGPPPPLPPAGLHWTHIASGDIDVSFESFPYYLCDVTKEELLSCANLHLVHANRNKFSSRVSSLSKLVLLSGPPCSQIYQEILLKALAKEFGALLLTISPMTVDESEVDQPDVLPKNGPLVIFLSNMFVQELEKDVAILPSKDTFYTRWNSRLHDMVSYWRPYGALVIGSYVHDTEDSPFDALVGKGSTQMAKPLMSSIFPANVTVRMPRDERQALVLKQKLDLDCGKLTARQNVKKILSVLDRAGWTCGTDLDSISVKDEVLTDELANRIVGFAISHHLTSKGCSEEEDDERVLSSESIEHGLKLIEAIRGAGRRSSKKLTKDVVVDNEFEKWLLADVVQPDEIGFTFDDVGALDNVKDVLRETVMLPLQRPKLFGKGQLRKPCKGILLFGPPGTGKTMLAKAVAKEAGANFINISTSSVTSKWYGEAEKYAKAVFTLASKLAPCVIFVDEVDSMLGARGKGEYEASRRVKNVFMTNWDGLRTKDEERVLVLAATNYRPFDLDEAVIRRFPRRLMVGLPDASNREKILRVILSKEELAPDVDMVAIANMTDGYSGSDLKQLCIVAAHRPLREILEKEKSSSYVNDGCDDDGLRPLKLDDFRYARENVAASASSSLQLLDWNNMYGEGGSRKKQELSYFA